MSTMRSYRDDFWHFEHAGWAAAAEEYATAWSGLTQQFVVPLLNLVTINRGARLLDCACGPGYVSKAATALGARPIGVDFSDRMIDQAKKKNPGLAFLVADAHSLPFASERFDVVVINFGVMHLSAPETAFAEAFRVLRPSGQLGFTLWAKPADNPRAQVIARAVEAHGTLGVSPPRGPSKFRFADPEESRRVLSAAGFSPSSVKLTTIRAKWQIPSADFWLNAERRGSVRTAMQLANQRPAVLEAIRQALEQGMQPYANNTGYGIPAVAHLVVATAVKA